VTAGPTCRWGIANRLLPTPFRAPGAALLCLKRRLCWHKLAEQVIAGWPHRRHHHRLASIRNLEGSGTASCRPVIPCHRLMERPRRPCISCGRHNAPFRCPCKAQSYCGAECQKASWLTHKKKCSVFLSSDLVAKRTEFGDDAVEVGKASRGIGKVFMGQEQFKDALKSFQRAERIYRLLYGELADVADISRLLGMIYHRQGQYEVARKKFKDALRIFRSVYGRNHFEVASTLNSFGATDIALGKKDKAAEKFRLALAMVQPITLPQECALALALLNNLGILHAQDGLLDKAMKNYVQVLRLWRSRLAKGPESSAINRMGVGTALLNIAHVLIEKEQLDEAMSHLDEALQLLRRVHGEKSTEAATVLCLVGDVYRKQCKRDEALQVYRRALRHRKRILGERHELVGYSMSKVAQIHMDRGYFAEALILFECAEGIQRGAVGSDHWEVACTCQSIAFCYRRLGDLDKCLASIRESLRIVTLTGSPEEVAKFAEKVQFCESLVQDQQHNL
jgi:tetratricopeptide (TPR) repeat protein